MNTKVERPVDDVVGNHSIAGSSIAPPIIDAIAIGHSAYGVVADDCSNHRIADFNPFVAVAKAVAKPSRFTGDMSATWIGAAVWTCKTVYIQYSVVFHDQSSHRVEASITVDSDTVPKDAVILCRLVGIDVADIGIQNFTARGTGYTNSMPPSSFDCDRIQDMPSSCITIVSTVYCDPEAKGCDVRTVDNPTRLVDSCSCGVKTIRRQAFCDTMDINLRKFDKRLCTCL